MGKVRIGLVFLVLLISVSVMEAFSSRVVYASSPIFQICILLDGSDSVSATEWDRIRDAAADAIVQAVPRNSTVELSVVQFGYASKDDYAKTEVMPIVIDNSNYGTVASHVRAISRAAGGTSITHGLSIAWQAVKNSAHFQEASRQIIWLVTDGVPSVRTHNSTSDLDESGKTDARDDFIAVINSAVGEGLDELDVEGIGMSNATQDWWKQWGVRPQPGSIAPPLTKPGWIRPSRNVTEFAITADEDLQSMLTENPQQMSWLIYAAVVSIVAIIAVVLIVLNTRRKRAKSEQATQPEYPPPPPPPPS